MSIKKQERGPGRRSLLTDEALAKSVGEGDCGCGGGSKSPANTQRQSRMIVEGGPGNPPKPTPTGHTLPFAPGGVFQLPKHIIEETQAYEPTPKPSSELGILPNAVLSESARLEAFHGVRGRELDVLPGVLLSGWYGRLGPLIPGAPGKWSGPLFIDPDAAEMLRAYAAVLAILRDEFVSPMIGNKKAGLLPGWTYFVTEDGIILRKWKKPGESPVPLPPVRGEEKLTECRGDSVNYRTVVLENTGEHPEKFAYDLYSKVKGEQDALQAEFESGESAQGIEEFKVVVFCDGKRAITVQGKCIGPCDEALENCRVQYVEESWENDIKPELETSNEPTPSYGEDSPPGVDIKFKTRVVCNCK